jgi:Ca-activated chloride channel family protein
MPLPAFRTSMTSLIVAVFSLLIAGCGATALPPRAPDPGAIIVEGTPGSSLILTGGERTVYARIRVSTRQRLSSARGAVNVALALDTSGSMVGAPIEEARRAAVQMIDTMRDGDRLAVVVFHSKTEVLLPSTELTDEVRRHIKRRVLSVVARGTTDMAGGLDAAIQEVRSNLQPKGVNRVVLLGDGIPNNAASIETSARDASERGIAITTVGLGLDYDETLMGEIAQLSGGRFRYIEAADKVAAFFQEELQRIDTVYARRASAVLTPGPGVRIESVVGSERSSPGGAAYVPLGDITHGDTRDIMVRMTVTPRKAGVAIELLDAVITFEDALEDAGSLERHVYFGATTSDDGALVAKATSPDVELSAALAEASATMIKALELARRGSFVRARELLTKGADSALAQARRTPSADLERHASNMATVAGDMPEVDAPTPPAEPSAPSSTSYEFSDDPLQGSSVEPVAPDVARKRKAAHQYAFDGLQ